jgi:hypothetical protein
MDNKNMENEKNDTVQNNTVITQENDEEAERKAVKKERREEIKRRIEQKRIEREKKKEIYEKLSTFQKLMVDEEESDESDIPELSPTSSSEGDDNSEVKTNRLLTANVGTSHKNSNSFRHVKTLNRTLTEGDDSSSSSDEDDYEVLYDKKKKEKTKKFFKQKKDDDDDKNSNRMYMDIKSDGFLSSYMSDFFDEGETLTFVQDDDQYKKVIEDEELEASPKMTNPFDPTPANMKQTAITILLSKKWSQKTKQEGKNSKFPIAYQPTFKMKPDINLSIMEQQIVKKVKQTFEVLCSKHQYDVEYTPKFIRIITEMIKNDVKTFKLDRYKIITHVTILKKMLGQSVFFISKFLCNGKDDYRFSIRSDNKTFVAICLIFLIYRE